MTARAAFALAALLLALTGSAQGALAADPPNVASPEALVVDASTGDVAYAKEPDARHAIASTTKLMTALITLEKGDLKHTVTAARYQASPAESIIGLAAGEKMTEADLLRGLLMASANDAAFTLADDIGSSQASFVRLMNRRAQQLGLTNTHYANAIGLDEAGNYSSARDLVTLTRVLRKHRFFRHTVNTNTFTLRSGAEPRTLTNRNTLLAAYPWVDGVKTGYTSQAGNVLVASGTKRGVHLISVVIGAASKAARDEESVELLNYGFTKYVLAPAVVGGHREASIPIEDRAGADLPVVAARTVRKVRRRGESFTLERSIPDSVAGPIHYGDKVGKLVVKLRGKPVATVALTAALEVPRAGVARRAQDLLTRPWMLIVIGIVLLAAVVLSQRRRPPRESTREREAAT